MEELKTKAADLKDHISEYAETYVQLAKVKATKAASTAMSGIVMAVVCCFFLFFFLFFVGFGLAWWVGTLIDSMTAGFFIIAVFFLFLALVFFGMRKKILLPLIRNAIIKMVYE